RPAVRGEDDISALDGQVVDRNRWQVELEGLPGGAIVERHPDPSFGAGEQQPGPLRIFPDAPREVTTLDTGRDSGPGRSVVGGLPEIRLVVIELIPIPREVRGTRLVRRRVDDG